MLCGRKKPIEFSKFVKILFSILILCFTFNVAFAHSCASYSRSDDKEHSQRLKKIDAIFYGEVVSIGETRKNEDEFRYGSQELKIKVLRVWKGIETNETQLLYTRAYTTFEEEIGGIGTKKIFYAYKRADEASLHIDSCSFNAFDDERTKREFGEGKVFEEIQSQKIQQEVSQNVWSSIWKAITGFFS